LSTAVFAGVEGFDVLYVAIFEGAAVAVAGVFAHADVCDDYEVVAESL
jgi:hypothetical protein